MIRSIKSRTKANEWTDPCCTDPFVRSSYFIRPPRLYFDSCDRNNMHFKGPPPTSCTYFLWCSRMGLVQRMNDHSLYFRLFWTTCSRIGWKWASQNEFLTHHFLLYILFQCQLCHAAVRIVICFPAYQCARFTYMQIMKYDIFTWIQKVENESEWKCVNLLSEKWNVICSVEQWEERGRSRTLE